MGYYIETESNINKAKYLIKEHKAVEIAQPKSFSEVPVDKGLVIIVDNVFFEAIVFIYSNREFEEFTDSTDRRAKRFLLLDRELVCKLTKYSD